jgi:SdrD B-like domain
MNQNSVNRVGRKGRRGRQFVTVLTALSLPIAGGLAGTILSAGATPGSLSGVVFRDSNLNGFQDPGDVGVSGVTVSAFASGTAAPLTVTTDANGSYSITSVTTGTQYRVEFTGLPGYLAASAQGTGAGSSVQFVTDATPANYAVQNPGDYCQSNPDFAMTCFAAGQPAAGSNVPTIHTASFDTPGTSAARNVC